MIIHLVKHLFRICNKFQFYVLNKRFLIIFAFSVLLTAGCYHVKPEEKMVNASFNPTDSHKSSKIDVLPAESRLEISQVLSNPNKYINKDVEISAYVNGIKLKDMARGLNLLELTLRQHSFNDIRTIELVKKDYRKINLAGRLNTINNLIIDAAKEVEKEGFDETTYLHLSYDLNIYGNKIRALSHYFKSKSMTDVGNSIEVIGEGYLKLGSALSSFSTVSKSIEFWTENQTDVFAKEVAHDPQTSNKFNNDIVEALGELNQLADLLILNRYEVLNHKLIFEFKKTDTNNAYSILSYGELFKARSWEHLKLNDRSLENKYKQVSRGFLSLGEGMNEIYDGFYSLSNRLAAEIPVIDVGTSPLSVLKCAYIGYNDHILKDCLTKMDQLGQDGEVTVLGKFIKGNYREEINVMWLKLESIEIDGLTIDLAYDDASSTLKNISHFYDWFKADN